MNGCLGTFVVTMAAFALVMTIGEIMEAIDQRKK